MPRRGGYWIDHAAVTDDDLSWLEHATELTLWNVTLPPGFLGRLPRLTWLDIRGGTGEALAVEQARSLKYLAVNQVRGLHDLSEIASLSQLRYLDLYGLARVCSLPPLEELRLLTRVTVGQMKNLPSLAPILQAPNLKELFLLRTVHVSASDVSRIQDHPTLEMFEWFAEDVPAKVSQPVLDQVKLPKALSMHPEEWFALHRESLV